MQRTLFSLVLPLIISCHNTSPDQAVTSVLNNLHLYAAEAKGSEYFDLFADDAIFFGTDIDERWGKNAFQEYGLARFETGQGWTYHMTERNIYFSDDDRTCWFDELVRNNKYGQLRGTGVLKLVDKEWKIAQYNLVLPMPNDLLPKYAQEIKEFYKEE